MDNRYRRDHGMAYFSDESIVAEQMVTKNLSENTIRSCLLNRRRVWSV